MVRFYTFFLTKLSQVSSRVTKTVFVGNIWICKRCWSTDSVRHRRNVESKTVKKESIRKIGSNTSFSQSTLPLSFPYDVSSILNV